MQRITTPATRFCLFAWSAHVSKPMARDRCPQWSSTLLTMFSARACFFAWSDHVSKAIAWLLYIQWSTILVMMFSTRSCFFAWSHHLCQVRKANGLIQPVSFDMQAERRANSKGSQTGT